MHSDSCLCIRNQPSSQIQWITLGSGHLITRGFIPIDKWFRVPAQSIRFRCLEQLNVNKLQIIFLCLIRPDILWKYRIIIANSQYWCYTFMELCSFRKGTANLIRSWCEHDVGVNAIRIPCILSHICGHGSDRCVRQLYCERSSVLSERPQHGIEYPCRAQRSDKQLNRPPGLRILQNISVTNIFLNIIHWWVG